MPQIYPSYGYTDLREPAFSFRWKDGSRITDLRYRSYSTYRGKRKPERLPAVLSDEDSEVLEIVKERIEGGANEKAALIFR